MRTESIRELKDLIKEIGEVKHLKLKRVLTHLNYERIDEYNLFIEEKEWINPFIWFWGNLWHCEPPVLYMNPLHSIYTRIN